MKRKLLLGALCFLNFGLIAQVKNDLTTNLEAPARNFDARIMDRANQPKTINCIDTLYYPYVKQALLGPNGTSGFSTFSLWQADGESVSQKFFGFSGMLVHGVEILGFRSTSSAATVVVRASIFNVDVNNNPVGTALGNGTVTISSTTQNFYPINFSSPIAVTGDYAVVLDVTNAGGIYTSFYNSASPGQVIDENLTRYKSNDPALGSNGSWIPMTSITGLGQVVDFEPILSPFVSYAINTSGTVSPTSACLGTPVTFTNTTETPQLTNRMYSYNKFLNHFGLAAADSTFAWDLDVDQNVNTNATADIVWSPNTSHSYVAAGTYSPEIISLGGFWSSCADWQTKTVSINAVDDASFSYSSSTVCAGGTDLTPTITTAGGTFTTTGALIIDAATGVVDVTDSPEGTYTITYTTAGACPNSSTQSLTITSAPSAAFTLSSDEVCGSASNVTATVTGSVGVFSSTTGLEINASTGEVNVAASTPGTYVVTNTIAASGSCPAATHNETLEIIAASNAAFAYSATAFCEEGSNPTITISGTAGTFSSTAGLEINATTGDLDIAASTVGTYVITNTVAATGVCPEVTSTETIVINALPTATASASGATATVVETTGATYQWINCDDDTEITGATSSTYAPSAPGSFQVVVTANGCSSTSACISVTNVSVSSVSLDNVAIFPNPASDVITIAGLTAAQSTITVLDVNGKVIISQVVTAAQTDLTIANVESGVYFIQVSSETLNGTKRFIKK